MRRPIAPAAAVLAAAIVTACAEPSRTGQPGAGSVPEDHVQHPMNGVGAVMRAKLVSAHALLEGIVLEDFRQIQENAMELRRLSQDGGWRLHKTSSYELFSAQFREILADLAVHAQGENLDAVALDYAQMTRTCVGCHSYMRSEGLAPQIPVAVSLRPARDGA